MADHDSLSCIIYANHKFIKRLLLYIVPHAAASYDLSTLRELYNQSDLTVVDIEGACQKLPRPEHSWLDKKTT